MYSECNLSYVYQTASIYWLSIRKAPLANRTPQKLPGLRSSTTPSLPQLHHSRRTQHRHRLSRFDIRRHRNNTNAIANSKVFERVRHRKSIKRDLNAIGIAGEFLPESHLDHKSKCPAPSDELQDHGRSQLHFHAALLQRDRTPPDQYQKPNAPPA